jgi:Rrf2 family protein
LRFLKSLSLCYDGEPVTLKKINVSENIPNKYLTHIALVLKSAGIIQSFTGPRGGYIITRPPDAINYLDVFEAFQGKLSISSCINYPQTCLKSSSCNSRVILEEISNKLSETLKSYSIQDLIDKEE